MTIITNRRAVLIVLTILGIIFLYLGFSDVHRQKSAISNKSSLGIEQDVAPVEGTEVQITEDISQGLGNENLSGDEFFIEYRLERDRRRAKEIELLQSLINDHNSVTEIKQEAQNKLLEITNSLDQELTLETLILARGYADAVVFVHQGNVSVVIRNPEFTEEDSVKIAELVARTTGYSLAKITIFHKG